MPSSTVLSWFSVVRVSVAMTAGTPRPRGSSPRGRDVSQLIRRRSNRPSVRLVLQGGEDAWAKVLGGGLPGGGVGRGLVAAADVLDLPVGALLAGEPDEGDAAAVCVADLLAELRGARGHLAGDAAGAQRSGGRVAAAPVLLVGDRDEHAGGDRAARRRHPGRDEAGDQPREADGEADAGIGVAVVGGETVIAPAGADRAERLVPGDEALEHGAGVVVQASGDREVRDDHAGHGRLDPLDDGGELGDALLDHLAASAEVADLLGEGGVTGADGGEGERLLRLLLARTGLVAQQGGHGVGADLRELVQGAQHGGVVL